MLRRRLIMTLTEIVRIYGELKTFISNKVRTVAVAVPAALAKLNLGAANANKIDSASYDASSSSAEVFVAAKPILDASVREGASADVEPFVTVASDIKADPIVASTAGITDTIFITKRTDAVAAEKIHYSQGQTVSNDVFIDAQEYSASLGDSKKIMHIGSAANAVDADSTQTSVQILQQIENKTEPLSSDAQLNYIAVSTCDKPSMIAVASEKIYSKLDANEGVEIYAGPDVSAAVDANLEAAAANEVSIVADAADPSIVLLNTHEVSTSISFIPEQVAATDADSTTRSTILVTFAPAAKVMDWIDPVLVDGSLLIRQAYGINKNNNTLEVI